MNEPITADGMLYEAFTPADERTGPVGIRNRYHSLSGRHGKWGELVLDTSSSVLGVPWPSLKALVFYLRDGAGWKIKPSDDPMQFQLLRDNGTIAHDILVVKI